MAQITIPQGATLSGIAKEKGTTIQGLLSLNPQIKDADLIFAGAQLNIPEVKPPTEETKEGIIDTSDLAEKEIGRINQVIADSKPADEGVFVAGPDGTFKVSKKDLPNLLGRGFGFATPGEKEKLSKEELSAVLGKEAEDTTPEGQLIKKTQERFDQQTADLKTAQNELESVKKVNRAAQNALIDSIKGMYESRRRDLEALNQRAIQQVRSIGIREGTERYSPLIATGMVQETERVGQQKILDLDRQEKNLIAEIQAKMKKEDYDSAYEKVNDLEKNIEKTETALRDFEKTIFENNKKIKEETKKRERQSNIAMRIDELKKSGITDPLEIINSINYDPITGEPITNYSPEEVDKVLDMVKASEKITDENRVNDTNKFFQDKLGEDAKITAADYLKAQQEWLSSGGNITDFKFAFPPEAVLDEDEVKKLPKIVYQPPKPEKPTSAEQKQTAFVEMNEKIKSVRKQDGYISPEDWNEAKQAWIDNGLNAHDFISQFYDYINPSQAKDYGQREANYIKLTGATGGIIINPEEIQRIIREGE